MRMYKSQPKYHFTVFEIFLFMLKFLTIEAAMFGSVSQLNIWITSSSVVNKLPDKSLVFRQIEINWINAPLDHQNDYIALYLDSRPRDDRLPVRVYRIDGQPNGQIITDYYLPSIDFYNETLEDHSNSSREPLYHLSNVFEEIISNPDGETVEKKLGLRRSIRREESKRRPLEEECIGYCIAYHSGSKILAENCLKTNPNWMQDSYRHLRSKALPALMIPGTHNSATYPKHLDESVLSMINKYQQNQEDSIFNQLVYGIRYLDLRVGYSKVKLSLDRFWIYHDIFRTDVSVREVLEQVKRFLELTHKEIVIMDFHRFTVGFHNEHTNTIRDRHEKLIDMIMSVLGDFIVPSYLGYHTPLGEYISMGRRLLVGYAERDFLLNGHMEFGAKLVQHPPEKQEEEEEEDAEQQVEGRVVAETQNLSDTSELHHETLIASSTSIGMTVSSTDTPQVIQSTEVPTTMPQKNETRYHMAKIISASSFGDNMYTPESMGGDSTGDSALSKATIFFPSIIHLWANKDSMNHFIQYLNETACRMHFGELRSLMIELTPTMFGIISDKYNGNRKLAELVNRPVTDMIRDRWLHCVNIVASDYFLGNDLIRLSIYGNRMRSTHQDIDFSSNSHCKSFRRVEHLIDRSKIPEQFIQIPPSMSDRFHGSYDDHRTIPNDTVSHRLPNGLQVTLKLLSPSSSSQSPHKESGDSFFESVSDGFSSLFSSLKKLLNL